MIPQNFKDILGSGNSGLLQTISLLLFLAVFLAMTYYVMSRPKKHYEEDAFAPLDDDSSELN